jgi:hypothetical protein
METNNSSPKITANGNHMHPGILNPRNQLITYIVKGKPYIST